MILPLVRLLASIFALVLALGVLGGLASVLLSSDKYEDATSQSSEAPLDDLDTDGDGDDDNEDAEVADLDLPEPPVDLVPNTHAAYFRGYTSPLPEPTTPPPRV